MANRDKRHTLALERFKLSAEAEAAQRSKELEVLQFESGDQWPDQVKTSRAGQGQPGTPGAVAARPMLTINKVDQPVQLTVNGQKNARLAPKVSPKGGKASLKTAEYYQGLMRNIDVESRASMARNWAYERAVKCGRGFYRIHKEYANDGDFDQDITIKRILNQGAVYLDPFAQEPDWSDGMWAFVTEDIQRETFKERYPKSKLNDMDDAELTATGDRIPGWITNSEAGWAFRVAEYWYVTFEKQTLVLFTDAQGNEDAQLEADVPEGATILRSRTVQKRRVDWCLISATEILDETEWEGRYIPIIPVIGKEYNLGGKRKWAGIVEGAMDAQRLFNYTASAIAEATAIAPKAPFILDPEQIEGYESYWQQANTRNFPYLPRKAFSGMTPYPPIERQVAEPPIQALTQLLNQADNYLKATTGVFDPSLGNLSAGERSGKAILALQKQAEQGNSNYLDNFAAISETLEGKILLDLIPKVYDRPGRVVRLLGLDDEPSSIMLGTPFVKGPDGQPQPAQEGMPGAETVNLADGEYSVVIEVGKAFSTRREEAVQSLTEVMGAVPQLAPVIAPYMVKDMDFPGSQELSDILIKTLPPNLQPEKDGQPSPEVQLQQLQQQAQQMGQMLQLTSKELEAKTRIIETEQVKAQAAAELERQKQDAETYRSHMDNQARIEIEKIKVVGDLLKTRATLEMKQTEAMIDATIAEVDRSVAMAGEREEREAVSLENARDRQFQREEGQASREQELTLTGAQMSHEADMAERQAAQPPAE